MAMFKIVYLRGANTKPISTDVCVSEKVDDAIRQGKANFTTFSSANPDNMPTGFEITTETGHIVRPFVSFEASDAQGS